LLLALPAHAQDADYDDYGEEEVTEVGPSPEDVLAAAPKDHWLPIPVRDLIIFTLPDDATGQPRQLVIQLLPTSLSGGHVRNVRKLANARWWDGTKVYRVAKNFVTQFGGNPDAKPHPKNLEIVPESEYYHSGLAAKRTADQTALDAAMTYSNQYLGTKIKPLMQVIYESYGATVGFGGGWPIGSAKNDPEAKAYPITCRGSLSPAHYDPPDAGSGAEMSIITGEAARSLDTSFGMVGRVIEGIEHAANLPLGTGAGGFYADKTEHIPITSVRLASSLPLAEQPRFEYLASYSPSLLQYIAAHKDYGNICSVSVPIRRVVTVANVVVPLKP
jgi:peptidylprolyl isomerase